MCTVDTTPTPSPQPQPQQKTMLPYESIGNVGNVLLFSLTSIITYCMLFQYPSPEKFDDNWLANGFCVAHADTQWWNSHVLSFYADAILAFCLFPLWRQSLHANLQSPPLQQALLDGATMNVLGHGLGHLYLGQVPTGMDLRWHGRSSIPMQLVSLFGFGSIFKGTMPLVSMKTLVGTAILTTLGFTWLDIPAKLNFVYAQAAIYLSSAISMLLLDHKYKKTAAYMLYPLGQLPVLVVGVLESTNCQKLLEPIGGHAIFDTTIALGVIAVELLSRRLEHASSSGGKMKTI